MSAAPDATLSEAELLAAWEEAVVLPHLERGSALLRRECVEIGEEPGQWPLGRHDARLLDLHIRAFGDTLSGTADCPACGEQVALTLGIGQLRTAYAESGGEHSLEVEESGHRVQFRLLCADDLAAAAREPDIESARRALLARCILAAEVDGGPPPGGELPTAVLDALGRRMAAEDPQAELRVALRCPACDEHWQADLEPLAFVFSELEDRARAALLEVASLAAAYGWSEQDVLAMSRERRRAYLELAGA